MRDTFSEQPATGRTSDRDFRPASAFNRAALLPRRGAVESTGSALARTVTAIRSPYLWLRSTTTGLLFERRYGVQTEGRVELEELGLAGAGRQNYQPAGWMCLRRILPSREVTERDVFVDFGSGMGRMVLQAARYPFRKVIGVELAEPLHKVACENIDRHRHRLCCPDIELVHADMLDYEIPEEVTVAFLYNPLRGKSFAALVERLLRSIEHNPRPLRIIYLNPVEEQTLLSTDRIQHVRTVRGWRPTREWSRSNSIRMYRAVDRPPQSRP